MILNYIIPPVIGAVIGYITNDIAIKMLFYPRKSYYIGRLHIPFTPGLIPKEKERIAASLGKAVGEQLLNEETISNTLISEEMISKLRSGIMICDVIKKYEDKLPDFTELVISAYKKLVCRSLASVLKGINLSGIVEERISGFDVVQFESLIFGLMKRELNAIVYLGALLGFLLGFINIFI